MILVPGAFPVGYGRVLAEYPYATPADHPLSGDAGADPIPAFGSTARLEDPQRGEILLELLDSDEDPFDPRIFLPVRYITRINPNANAPGMMSGGLSSAYLDGQVVVIFDIPLGTISTSGDYHIAVYRYRREDPGAGDIDDFEQLSVQTTAFADFLGWGAGYSSSSSSGAGTGSGPIDIHILDGTVDWTTPKAGWTDFAPNSPLAWSDFSDDIDDLIPYPVAWVSARQTSPPGDPPAAWEVELTYPRSLVAIRGVTSRNTTPGNAIISWDDGGDPGTVTCSTPDQTLTIHVLDPHLTTRSVNVAFELEDTFEDTCGARIQPADFQEVSGSFKGFDEDGNEATSLWFLDVQGDSPAFR